jgi:hypothetical protein
MQGFTRQALYHLSHSTSPCFILNHSILLHLLGIVTLKSSLNLCSLGRVGIVFVVF